MIILFGFFCYNVYTFYNAPSSKDFEIKLNSVLSTYDEKINKYESLVIGFDRDTERAKALNISRIPTVVVLDSEKVVLQTESLQELEQFFNK
ncbi:hypothetical protein LJK88_45695 [Paenibacillus sp. P26]|nr:hypothetical protein LJK88_45695 [Paenibacillus sp. P26]